jgi:SAM-dependent methyltransferase
MSWIQADIVDLCGRMLSDCIHCRVFDRDFTPMRFNIIGNMRRVFPHWVSLVAATRRLQGRYRVGNIWDERYAGDDYFFGVVPNAFLLTQQKLLQKGGSCLAVADGEGRNGVWLAEQGLSVMSVENSAMAMRKARALAEQRHVNIDFVLADILAWEWGTRRFDFVVAIFIQFVTPDKRQHVFDLMKRCLKPGGYVLLQGYTPRQIDYGTGGPSQVENLYTEDMLRTAFSDMEIVHLREHDDHVSEGIGHHGMSALIDLVARARVPANS